MAIERSASGWATTGVSSRSSATRSLTVADIDAYVQRDTATVEEVESLANDVDRTLDVAHGIATKVVPNSVLAMALSNSSVSELARDIEGVKARRFIRTRMGILASALGSLNYHVLDLDLEVEVEEILADASNLATTLEVDAVPSGFDRARLLAVRIDRYVNVGDRTNLLLLAQVGLAIYGSIALSVIPVSVSQREVDVGVSGFALPGSDVDVLTSVGVLMSPIDEERITFEPVSSLIERAIDTGDLSDEVEHDLRIIGRMMADCRRMMTDTGDDLYEAAARKLDLLLPAVLEAIQHGSSPATATILKASESGASTNSQVAAIDAAMAVASDSISQAAQSLPTPEAKAFAPIVAEALDRYSDRIEKTLPSYERFQANLGRIARLGPVRAAIWGGGTALGVAAQAAAISADMPIPASTTQGAAVSAVLSGIVLKWMYARQRRMDPTLPGLPQSGDRGQTSDPSAGTPGTPP